MKHATVRHNRDVKLLVEVETTLRLGRYSPGRIEFTPTETAPPDLASRLGQRLQTWTGARWGVSVVSDATAPTIAETRDAARLEQEGLEPSPDASPEAARRPSPNWLCRFFRLLATREVWPVGQCLLR